MIVFVAKTLGFFLNTPIPSMVPQIYGGWIFMGVTPPTSLTWTVLGTWTLPPLSPKRVDLVMERSTFRDLETQAWVGFSWRIPSCLDEWMFFFLRLHRKHQQIIMKVFVGHFCWYLCSCKFCFGLAFCEAIRKICPWLAARNDGLMRVTSSNLKCMVETYSLVRLPSGSLT